MATRKKSLVSNLKTAKKAKIASGRVPEVEGGSKKKAPAISYGTTTKFATMYGTVGTN